MKYYSEVLDKLFDSVEELEAEEGEIKKVEEQKSAYQKRMDKIYDEIVEKCNEYIEVYKEYSKILDKTGTTPKEKNYFDFDEIIESLFG